MQDLFFLATPQDDLLIAFSPLRHIAAFVPKGSVRENIILTSPFSEYLPIAPSDETTFFNRNHLIVLLTNKCNLSCGYCYSQFSRNFHTISPFKLKTVIDYTLDNQSVSKKRITFAGGGEPVLEWDILQHGIEYIRSKDNGCTDLSIVTNGTLLNRQRIEWLIKNNVRINVSFDILPDLQDMQRPHRLQSSFELVDRNLLILRDLGQYIALRTTVTNNTVCRIPEIVEFVAAHYPHVNCLNIWPEIIVREIDINIDQFYDQFINSFIETYSYAETLNIKLCNWLTVFDRTHSRFCQEDFCVSPSGDITTCLRSASPGDLFYEVFKIGEVTDEGINVAKDKLDCAMDLLNTKYPECKSCFAKWSCAGMCPNTRLHMELRSHKDSFCRFTRNFISSFLYDRLKSGCGVIDFNQHKSSYG